MSVELRQRSYLQPYVDATAAHGAQFGALLWASPATQSARFAAIREIVDLNGKSVLDVGCGRADLLEHLLQRGIRPADYVGIEALDALADAADAKRLPRATIIRADFVAEPLRLFVGAEVVLFSGSLNTADDAVFYSTLTKAFDAAAQTLVFNFLSSPQLAGKSYLHWRRPENVIRFAQSLSPCVEQRDDYLPGDVTIRVEKRCERR